MWWPGTAGPVPENPPTRLIASYACNLPAPVSESVPATTQSCAETIMWYFSCAGVSALLTSSISAATPATNGAAMLVPEYVTYPLPEPAFADVMLCPGPHTSGFARPSAVGPRDDHGDTENPFTPGSEMLHTVSAFAAAAGEPTVDAAGPLFPAATTGRIPRSAAVFTIADRVSVPLDGPTLPKLMLMMRMLYVVFLSMHHCTAEMIADVEPVPDEFIALTPTRAAPGATPRYAALPSPCPARIADTCVPCPLSSYGDVRPL